MGNSVYYYDVIFEKYNERSMKMKTDVEFTYYHESEFTENEVLHIVSQIKKAIIDDFGLREGNVMDGNDFYQIIHNEMFKQHFRLKPRVTINL